MWSSRSHIDNRTVPRSGVTVSVVMPAFNAAQYISDAIKSVLDQSYTDWELIIVDDGSVDDTLEIAKQFVDDRIVTLRQCNAGVAAARNAALRRCRGRYVAFLDADDFWYPQKLSLQVNALESDSGIGIVHSETMVLHQATGRVSSQCTTEYCESSDPFHKILTKNSISTSTVILRRSNLLALVHPEFDERLRGTEDWDLWLRLLRNGRVLFLREPLAVYRILPGSLSRNFSRHHRQEFNVLKRHCMWNNTVPTTVRKRAIYNHEKRILLIRLSLGQYRRAKRKACQLISKYGAMYMVHSQCARVVYKTLHNFRALTRRYLRTNRPCLII